MEEKLKKSPKFWKQKILALGCNWIVETVHMWYKLTYLVHYLAGEAILGSTCHKGELFKGTALSGILNEALATRKSLVGSCIENVGEWPWQ